MSLHIIRFHKLTVAVRLFTFISLRSILQFLETLWEAFGTYPVTPPAVALLSSLRVSVTYQQAPGTGRDR